MKFSTCFTFALSTEKSRWHLYFCAWQHWGAVLHQRVQDEDEAWGATSCWDLSLLRPHFNVLPPGMLCPFASPSLGHGSQLSPKSAHQGLPPSVRSSTNNTDIIYPCLPTPESRCFLMAQFHPAGLCDFPGSFKETCTNSNNTVAESGCLKAHKFFLNFLSSLGFKETFNSRLCKGEIGNLPRAKFSPALPNATANMNEMLMR